MSSDAVLLAMQAPNGIPRSTFFETVTDPLLPPSRTSDMLEHFPDSVYDLRPESHLSRLLKVLLGDSGTGQLRKRYTYAHLSQFILTTHFNDLDALYADVFGLKRLFRERLTIDPYLEAATDEEWEALLAADAAYRARIEAFSHAIPLAGTPDGMAIAASAVLGEECRVYESYAFLDDQDIYAADQSAEINNYGDLEVNRYADLEGQTYAALEGANAFQGRANSRGEFIVRPLRSVTAEERFHLIQVLGRLKPAQALLTIDARPAAVHKPVPVHRATASSSYWHVKKRVSIDEANASMYSRYDPDAPVEQPRPAFSEYQGEAWSYNTDVVSVSSYVEDAEGKVVQDFNYERVTNDTGRLIDYTPDLALADPMEILLGRYVSDGVMSISPASREAGQ
jgi:hypothetical protein